jgi:hypothetical protein
MRRLREKSQSQVIDAALGQGLASPTWRNADRCAVSRSLLMLAVTAGAFLLVTWIVMKGFFFFL